MDMDRLIDFASSPWMNRLEVGADGIWYASEQEEVSYPSQGNDQCFEIEDKSFWFRHRNECIVELVRNFPPSGNGPIFDVGGGNGAVAKAMMDRGWDTVLVEPGPSGARNAKARGLRNVVCATTQAAGFKAGSIPAIGTFDVIEHIEDDLAFLRHLHRLLGSGGMLYLTVPAIPLAWSNEDIYAGHFRRYTLGTLSQALNDVGLEIQFVTSIFSWLLIPILLFRALPHRLLGAKGSAHAGKAMHTDHSLPAALAPLANTANSWELMRISRRKPIRIGSSLLCAARKI